MKPLRVLAVLMGLSVVGLAFLPAGCGDATQHPAPLNVDKEGGRPPFDGTAPPSDAARDQTTTDTGFPDTGGRDAAEAGGDAGGPGCNDTIKDNLETDVDCGGPVCAKCIDGKTCVAGTDCVGGSCIAGDGGTNVCVTPSCTDKVKNGTETDVDCGGTTCPKCTFGKACALNGDCVSQTCVNNGVTNSCSCPVGMTVVATSAALGGAYCVDETEVQAGQYNAFLNANQPINTQIPQCLQNSTFVPQGAWPPPQPLTSFGLPVRYVDWCDAYAYCKWAGKQMCGQIGGGTLNYTLTDANDKSKSSWYNACSAQGVNRFPYDVAAYNALSCRGNQTTLVAPHPIPPDPAGPWFDWAYNANGGNAGQPLELSCQGGSVNLFQMSGNVAEWEDSCSAATGLTDTCRIRGGSYLSNDVQTDLECKADRTAVRNTTVTDVGIRCCQY